MSKVTVPFGSIKLHRLQVGNTDVEVLLRAYQNKPSWDKAQSDIPDRVTVTAITPWSEVSAYSTRTMTLTESTSGDTATIEWTVARQDDRPTGKQTSLSLRAIPGAVEARWDPVPGSSRYLLQWREPNGQYEDINTKPGGRVRATIEIGPSQIRVFRVKAVGQKWSEEISVSSLPWTAKHDWKVQPYETFEAENCWSARTKPCYYDRDNLIDVEILFDDPKDDLPPVVFQQTAGLNPKSDITEYFWRTDTPSQLRGWSSRHDHGRSIAQAEIERQAAFLRNQRILLEIQRSGTQG